MKKFIYTALTFVFSNVLAAQIGLNDPTFNSGDVGFSFGDGSNSTVSASFVQPDGNIVFAGAFTTYNGVTLNRIARITPTGALDLSFTIGTGFNNSVNTMLLQPDGKILVGGSFTSFNGTGRAYLARINANGTLDNNFNVGTGANGAINTIALQADGKIVIGGNFRSYNGITRDYIARVNADGTLDNSFNPGFGADNQIQSIVVQTDGKIVVAGNFTLFNGAPQNRIVRLNANGSVDNTFNVGTGANNIVQSLALQPDGKLLIGGTFTNYNGVTVNRIARLNTSGSIDNTFNLGTGLSGGVNSIQVLPNSKILVCGSFATYAGVPANRLVRILSNGSLDASFTSGSGPNATVQSFAVQADNKIIITGLFTFYGSTGRNRIMRIDSTGTIDLTFNTNTGADQTVASVQIQPDAKILVAGSFTNYNGVSRNRIVRILSNGDIDTSFNIGIGANGAIQTMLLQPDGRILIGGDFTNYNGVVRNRIARLNANGSLDTTFNPGTGALGSVLSIALQTNGQIVIGGNFLSYNGVPRVRLARLNANGSLDLTFDPLGGVNSSVLTIAVQPDGRIIAGGLFIVCNGDTVNRIARFLPSGARDFSFVTGVGFNSTVHAIAIQSNGKILIGGSFSRYNNTNQFRMVRLNQDGSLDGTFVLTSGGPSSTVNGFTFQPDGKIIVFGAFPTINGVPHPRIARIFPNGSVDLTFYPGAGTNNTIQTCAIQPDGRIVIGGTFTAYNGTGRNRLARVLGDCTYPDVPNVTSNATFICQGNSATLSITSGNLFDATAWNWYSGTCGGTPVGTGSSLVVSPSVTTTYYARGEGGCVVPGVCDSVTIQVYAPNNFVISPVVCDTYTAPDGQVYTNSGTYTAIVPNPQGCNTVFNDTYTINLTVKKSSNSVINPIVCDTYTAPDNSVYTQSGTYTATIPNFAGCDSIISIQLTVNQSSATTITPVACSTYTAPDGQIYTQSGTYNAMLTGTQGCDSNITIQLTVLQPSVSTLNASVCEGDAYTAPDGQLLTQPGTYTITIPNTAGCDSIITLQLAPYNVDASVQTIWGNILQANASNATFQWVNCDAGYTPIAGETQASFTPSVNGTYAVIVNDGICSDTSACILVSNVSINEQGTTWAIYPNPTTQGVYYQSNTTITAVQIWNVSGQLLTTIPVVSTTGYIDLSGFSAGVYWVKLWNNNQIIGTEKLIRIE